MNFSRTEKVLLGLSAWGILLLLAWPLVRFAEPSPSGIDSEFATVVPDGVDVRHRGPEDYDWRELGRALKVARNEKIRTGEASRARIVFAPGGEWRMESRTVLALSRDSGGAPVAELAQGLFYADLVSRDLVVNVDGRLAKVAGVGSKVKLERTEEGLILQLIQGPVNVGGRPLTIPSSKINLSKMGDLGAPEFVLFRPRDGGVVWTEGLNSAVDFTWLKANGGDSVLILRSANGDREIVRRQTKQGFARIEDLPVGDYEWELREPSGEHPLKARFRLRPVAPPVIRSVRSQDSALRVAWVDPSVSDLYRIVISEASGSERMVFSTETLETTVQTPALARGTYRIEVSSAKGGRSPSTLRSDLFTHFHDSRLPSYDEPARMAEHAYKIELTWPGAGRATPGFVPQKDVSFEWSGLRGEAVVQVAEDYGFEKVIDQFESNGGRAVWEKGRAGEFYVRTRSREDSERKGWTGPAKLRVIYAAPVLRALARDDDRLKVRVVWEAHPDVARFEVVGADNAAFLNARKLTADEMTTSFPLRASRPLYVKVRGMNADGWPVTRFSDPAIYQPLKPAPPPAILAGTDAARRSPMPASEEAATPFRQIGTSVAPSLRRVFDRVARIWAGIGFNDFNLGQSDDALARPASFSNSAGPTMMLELSTVFKDFYQLLFGFYDQPGAIENPQYGLTGRNSHWQTLMLDASAPLARASLFGASTDVFWKAGLQRHRFPFVSLDQGVVRTTTNTIDNLAVGVGAETRLAGPWALESSVRYQLPFQSGASAGSIRYRPGFSYDGSIGIHRRIQRNYLVGLYWSGQSQDLSYSHDFGGSTTNGTQTFFDSNVQLRLGYEFLAPVGPKGDAE